MSWSLVELKEQRRRQEEDNRKTTTTRDNAAYRAAHGLIQTPTKAQVSSAPPCTWARSPVRSFPGLSWSNDSDCDISSDEDSGEAEAGVKDVASLLRHNNKRHAYGLQL